MRYGPWGAAILGAAVLAGEAPAAEPDAETGRELFATYCAACHGFDATGSGPMAEILAVATPDLTQLSAENDGRFPIDRVARQIDGRDPALAHGGTMPLFGNFFEGESVALAADGGQPMLTSKPIADLILWLESVQAP